MRIFGKKSAGRAELRDLFLSLLNRVVNDETVADTHPDKFPENAPRKYKVRIEEGDFEITIRKLRSIDWRDPPERPPFTEGNQE